MEPSPSEKRPRESGGARGETRSRADTTGTATDQRRVRGVAPIKDAAQLVGNETIAPLLTAGAVTGGRPGLLADLLTLQRTVGNRSCCDLLAHAAGTREVDGRQRRSSLLERALRIGPPQPAADIQRVDQHEGVGRPDAASQALINQEFFPAAQVVAAGAPPARIPWTGAAGAAGMVSATAQVARQQLKGEIWGAFDRNFLPFVPSMRAREARYLHDALPMTSFVGAGRAAKRVADTKFAGFIAHAAFTASQATARHNFAFTASGPGQNLMDAYSLGDRVRMGAPVSAESVLWWLVARGDSAQAQAADHLVPLPGSDEEQWLDQEVIVPYANLHRSDLECWDRFGFALTSSDQRVVIGTLPVEGLSNASPAAGLESPAVRARRWRAWQTLVHEYLHVVEHPTFLVARSGTGVSSSLAEGFCEYFTKQVLDDVLPQVSSDVTLRSDVEGSTPPPWPPTNQMLPRTYDYNATYFPDVQKVLTIKLAVSENGLRVAYFQGHVETIGLDPAGAQLAPVAAGTGGGINIPAGTTLSQVMTRFNVTQSELARANPTVAALTGRMSGHRGAATTVLPTRINIPGWAEHVVVAARAAGGAVTETRDKIAAQHGMTRPGDLDTANPAVNWAALHSGDIILIPPH